MVGAGLVVICGISKHLRLALFCRFIWPSQLKSVILHRDSLLKSVVFDCQKLLKSVNGHALQEDFYLTLSMVAGDKLNNREDTLVFLDEIRHQGDVPAQLSRVIELKTFDFITFTSANKK